MKLSFTSVFIILLMLSSTLFNAQNSGYSDEELRNYPYWFDLMQKEKPNYFEVKRAYDLYFEKHQKVRGSMFKIFERWAWKYQGDFEPDGRLNTDKIARAYEMYLREFKDRGPTTNTGKWKEIGPLVYPVNVSGQETGTGRVNAIAFHPTDEDIFWVGAPSGGLWKTEDGGSTYTCNTDQMPTLGVSSIVIDPLNPDIMYIGTGDRDAGDAPGLGVFKSDNGGISWTLSSNGMGSRTVGCMIMHPTINTTLLTATSNGIYKSTDSGVNWTLKSANTNFYKDVVFHPTDPNYVYATASGSFYRSNDGGETWTPIVSGLVACSRMVIGVSEDEPNSVFCLLTGGSQKFQGIFKSIDQGLNFTRITPSSHLNILGYTDGDDNSQANYDLCILVNPTNANQILVGSICIHRSDNGGVSFSKKANWSNQVHADQHVVALNPLNNRIYEGHDGGLHYSDDYFDTWSNVSGGLRIAQTYRIGQAANIRNLVFNGYQDNGSSIFEDGVFSTVAGGDGMESAFDYSDDDYAYTTYIQNIKRSHKGGYGGWTSIAKEGSYGINENGAWVTPYMLHVNDPNTMFFGYKNIWRSNNVKSNPPTWTKISDLLGGVNNSNVLYIDQSFADNNVFYCSKDNNTLFRSDNINAATPGWIDLSANLPNGNANIDDVLCHPTDSEIIYLIQSEKVYKSGDRGNTWTNITGSLPSGTNLNCLVFDKFSNEGIYVGTKTGVFYKNASLSDWIAYDGSLPVVDVREMEIYYGNTESRLRAGTYGRGLWETDLYYNDEIAAPVANFSADKTVAFVNELVSFEDISAYGPDTWSWTISPATFAFENGTDANSQHPEVKFTATGFYTVSLTVSNANGNNSKTINSYINIYFEVIPTCTPATQTLGNYGMGIDQVILNTINRSSGMPHEDNPNSPAGYMNFITTDNTVLKPNTQYQLTVVLGTGYTEYWKFFIDYNNDGDFLDPDETVYSSPTKVSGSQTINFTTQASPTMNQLIRMRIICDFNNITGPCYNPAYGQAEDYGIIFKNLPTLTSNAVSSIQYNSANSGGDITDQGSSAIVSRGIVWDIRENPALDKNWGYTVNGSGTGTFSVVMLDLSPNISYYVRSYAINGEGISYGQSIMFTTLPQNPVVTTADIANISYFTAESGGNVANDNGSTVTSRGIVWDISPNPTLSRNIGKTENGTGAGSFISNLTGLTPNTTYYVKAYARNGYSASYGTEKVFTTLSPDPNQSRDIVFQNVTTNKITVTWTNGTGQYRIVKINNSNSFAVPVNGTNPATNTVYDDGEQVIYNGTGASVTVTNLSPSTTYYFHVFDYDGSGNSTVFNQAPGINNPRSTATYCVPTYANDDVGTHIKQFILNKIINTSGASHYSDFTNISTKVLKGGVYDVSFQMSYNPLKLNIWIDFNDNMTFEQSEKLLSDFTCAANTTTTTQITIPVSETSGPHILRVRGSFNSGAGPCDITSYGETEDYTADATDKFTWNGTTSTSWFTSANWDVGKIPAITNEVIIKPASFQPVIEISETVNAKKVTMNNGATISINGILNVIE